MSKISIITINLNSFNALNQTISSLKLQDRNLFELIIIDGKSNDIDALEMNNLRRFADILISEKDNGIADAWNKGIKLSKNNWILILNSGDILEKDILRKLILYF